MAADTIETSQPAETPAPPKAKGTKRKRLAKHKKRARKQTRVLSASDSEERETPAATRNLQTRAMTATALGRFQPQPGKGNPWEGIKFIADEVKPASAAVRKALADGPRGGDDNDFATNFEVGKHFRPSEQALEVAWQGDDVGWGVRWAADVVLGSNVPVGVFAGVAISLAGQPNSDQARWIFDTAVMTNDGERVFIDLLHSGNALRFANHSCQPNCVARLGRVKGLWVPVLFVKGKQKLQPGEWISFSYGAEATAGAAMKNQRCHCGAPNCRGWIFPLTEEEKAAFRRKKREKLQRRLTAIDEQRAKLVARLHEFQSPSPLMELSDSPRQLAPLARVRPKARGNAIVVPNSFFVPGRISHDGTTYYRQAEPQASGVYGMVWHLWADEPCTDRPVAVLKMAKLVTIEAERCLWERIAKSDLNLRAPLFPRYFGVLNRSHCRPKVPREFGGLLLSYGGNPLYSLGTDRSIGALSARNVAAAAFQLVWAVRTLQYVARLQHNDLHSGNITYIVRPSVVTAWSRTTVWQFDTLLVLNIIDVGNAELVEASEATLHADMKRALSGLLKSCKRQGGDIKELRQFIAGLDNSNIRSSAAIDASLFKVLRSAQKVDSIAELVKRASGEDPVMKPFGMVIETTAPQPLPAGAIEEVPIRRCGYCGFMPAKPGKPYCKSAICKAQIKSGL